MEKIDLIQTEDVAKASTEGFIPAVATTKWIKNEAEGTKQCEACGAVMRGWAYREDFAYCPKCGAKAE